VKLGYYISGVYILLYCMHVSDSTTKTSVGMILYVPGTYICAFCSLVFVCVCLSVVSRLYERNRNIFTTQAKPV